MIRREQAMPIGPSALNGKHPQLVEAFQALAEEGLGVIDVGSRGGVQGMLMDVAPLLHVVGFEPDREEWQRLVAAPAGGSFKSLTHLPYALGESDGERVLYVNRERGTSSFYQPNREFLARFPHAARYETVTTTPVPVRSLDSLLADPESRLPKHLDFIKLDTQGSELGILRGARRTLEHHIVALEVEVEFTRLYRDQPLFHEIDAWLEARGFTLFKLRRQTWVRRTAAHHPHLSAGQLVFADALYLRDPLGSAPPPKISCAPRQVEALILLAGLYDLNDFALELLSVPSLVTGLRIERIHRWIAARSRKLASVRERMRRFKALTANGEVFGRYGDRWVRGDDDFYSSLGR